MILSVVKESGIITEENVIASNQLIDKRLNYGSPTSITLGASGSYFTMPFDGYVKIKGTSTSAGGNINLYHNSTDAANVDNITIASGVSYVVLATSFYSKGTVVYYQFSAMTLSSIQCIPYTYYNLPELVDVSNDIVSEWSYTPASWYRKYRSKWVECGGQITFTAASSADNRFQIVTLPVTMGSYNYSVSLTMLNSRAGNLQYWVGTTVGGVDNEKTTTTFGIGTYSPQARVGERFGWEVKGFMA